MHRKMPVPFGKGPPEKDPHHGHLAGDLAGSIAGLQITGVETYNTMHYPFGVIIRPGDRLSLDFSYRPDLFTPSAARRVTTGYERLLRAIAEADPDTPADRIDMLSPEERRQVLVEWNDTAQPMPEWSLAQALAGQAAAAPGQVAVVSGPESVTYAELEQRAADLAAVLAERAGGAEDLVALAIPRSVDMVVALLAVLKTGAAYLPIDPDYPADRIAYMLADARPALLLTTAETARQLPPEHRAPVILI